MRTLIAWTLTLVVGASAAGLASAQAPVAQTKKATTPNVARPVPAPVPAPAPLDPATIKAKQEAEARASQEMKELLAAWEDQSKKTTSLDVGFLRIDSSKAWGTQYYRGRAMLKSPDLACLEFHKYKVGTDGKPIDQLEPEASQRIVCNGEKVLQFEYDEKTIYVHPLEKEVRQKALQQGPLPFLFNMKAAQAGRRYGMTLLQEDAKEYLIGILPREDVDRESFTRAFLWLSKETFLPNKLRLYPSQVAKNADVQEFRFVGEKNTIQINRPMPEALFNPSVKLAGWKTIVNPGGVAAQPAIDPAPVAAPVAQPRRQAAQPAMRPTGRPQ